MCWKEAMLLQISSPRFFQSSIAVSILLIKNIYQQTNFTIIVNEVLEEEEDIILSFPTFTSKTELEAQSEIVK